jgi:hypothetical protein
MTPRAVSPHQERDVFLKSIYWVLDLILKLLRYLGRRSIQHPVVGLSYLVIAFPAAFLLVQDLRLHWAAITAPPFSEPAPAWPLTEPIQPIGLGLLVLALVAVVAFDRWIAHRTASNAANRTNEASSVGIDEWVLGRTYKRTWSPDPGEFQVAATGELYKLTEEHLRTHLLVVAPTGSGKTRSVLEPALHLFKRIGAAALYIDAKGDDFNPKDFHLNFDLDQPATSMRLNVWSGRTPREMGERLAEALVPQMSFDKAYFSNNAKDTVASLVAAHHAAYGDMPSLQQLLGYLRDPEARQDLAEELRNIGLPSNCDELLDLHRINQLSEQKNDVLGSLDTALAPLARGEIADLLTTARDGYSVEQLLAEPVRVRFALSEGLRPRVAPIIGRLVLAQFTHTVISPYCNKSFLKAAVVDEAGSFITPTIARGMAMARQNRGCFMLAVQNLSQIEDPVLREDILSVAGNKMVMAGVGDFDADKFSRLFGSQERPYTMHSQSTSQGSHSSHSRGSGHGGYHGFGGDLFSPTASGTRQQSTRAKSSSLQQSQGSSIQLRERADFLPGEIRSLPKFHVIIERRDARGEATPPTIVHLDMVTIADTCTAQALHLYNQVGHLEAIAPKFSLRNQRAALGAFRNDSRAEKGV